MYRDAKNRTIRRGTRGIAATTTLFRKCMVVSFRRAELGTLKHYTLAAEEILENIPSIGTKCKEFGGSYPSNIFTAATAANIPTRSAMIPTGTACRVFLMLTTPK